MDDSSPTKAASPAAAPTEEAGEVQITARFPRKWLAGIVALGLTGSGAGTVLASRVFVDAPQPVECPNDAKVEQHDRQLGDHEQRTRELERVATRVLEKLEGIAGAVGEVKSEVARLNSRRR